jgi:hypothetical protein
MGGRLAEGGVAASGALGEGTFRGSTPGAFFLVGLVFFVLSMGSLGILLKTG